MAKDAASFESRSTRCQLVVLLCVAFMPTTTAAVVRLPLSYRLHNVAASPSTAAFRSSRSISCCQSELEWRRQQSELAGRSVPEPSPTEEEAGSTAGYVGSVYSDQLISDQKKGSRQQPNLSTSVDDMNFFGATGGGQLTRENIRNARKTTSPRIDAMEALSAACKEKQPSAAKLSELIGDAYQAGVAVDAPQMKKAAALLAALESAMMSREEEQQAAQQDPTSGGDISSKLDALFVDEYSLPELDEDL